MNRRFKDNHERIYGFGDHFLVECPRCGQCAEVLPKPPTLQAERVRMVCSACGNVRNWQRQSKRTLRALPWSPGLDNVGVLMIGTAVDWYFHLPLWLRIGCCGSELWAYNPRHLAALEEYIDASLRERSGTANGSWATRLPRWMKSAKNREELLICLRRLREKLAG